MAVSAFSGLLEKWLNHCHKLPDQHFYLFFNLEQICFMLQVHINLLAMETGRLLCLQAVSWNQPTQPLNLHPPPAISFEFWVGVGR